MTLTIEDCRPCSPGTERDARDGRLVVDGSCFKVRGVHGWRLRKTWVADHVTSGWIRDSDLDVIRKKTSYSGKLRGTEK